MKSFVSITIGKECKYQNENDCKKYIYFWRKLNDKYGKLIFKIRIG